MEGVGYLPQRSVDDADCALCMQKTTHTDQSEVMNGYEMLCGCEDGIFENVLTKEGEEYKVSSYESLFIGLILMSEKFKV